MSDALLGVLAGGIIEQLLTQLREGLITNVQQQNHNGIGDNIGRDKVININSLATSQSVKYNLTEKQKNALKLLVEIGRTWREEFYIIWFPPTEISVILEHSGNPPQISKGEIRALGNENLLLYEFLDIDRALITLLNS